MPVSGSKFFAYGNEDQVSTEARRTFTFLGERHHHSAHLSHLFVGPLHGSLILSQASPLGRI